MEEKIEKLKIRIKNAERLRRRARRMVEKYEIEIDKMWNTVDKYTKKLNE